MEFHQKAYTYLYYTPTFTYNIGTGIIATEPNNTDNILHYTKSYYNRE